MKKRLLTRNRRGAVRRGVGFSFAIVIGMSTLLGFAAQIVTPQTAQAATTDYATDLKRRQLHSFAECITKQYINEDVSKITYYDDIFDSEGRQAKNFRETVIVGLDRDENGLITCNGAIRQGAKAMNPSDLTDTSDEGIQNWLLKRLTGKTFNMTGGQAFSTSGVEKRMNDLHAEIKKSESYISGPDDKLRQRRMFPLAQMCYEAKEKADGALGSDGFRIDGVGYFYLKSSEDVQKAFLKAGFIKESGSTAFVSKSVGFGDLNLQFTSKRGATDDFNAGGKNANDFYPIGSDISQTKGYKWDAVVDCLFVKKNKDLILSGATIGEDGKIIPPAGITTTADNLGGGNNEEANDADCQIQGTLGWVLNPICDIAVQSTRNLGDYILERLEVEPLTQGNTPENGIYQTWRIFRDLANAFLVLIFLIAIFAQVLPIEVDSYTVKKTLPKLIAAAIGIQFSYFICQILIDITNVAGGGITSLINSVITQLPGVPDSGSAANFASYMFIGVAGVAIALTFIGPVLMLLVAGLISIITMLITIEARQVILIFLVIASPLALLAWILPNTEQYAQKWGKNFLKLLFMYPIIAFILAGGQLAYVVMSSALGTGTSTSDATTIQQVMINFIPVITFFMIPATFKASGAIMGAISNAGFARANRSKARAGSMLKSGYVEPLKGGVKNLSKTTGVKMLGSDSRFGRTAGRALTGNMFSYGKSGRRKIANEIKALKHEELESQVATVKGLNAGNDVIGEIISARLDGKDTYTYKDRAGETQTIKLTDDMVAGGIKYLNDNGGQIELAKIGNGTMDYKDSTSTRFNKKGESVSAAKAAFNSAGGGSFEKLGKGGRFAMGEIFKETTDGNVAALMKAAPHLVHGKKAAVYEDAGGDVFAGIKGDSMDVAASVISGDTTGKAQANFADALVEIMQSSARSGGIDKAASKKMEELIINDPRVGAQLIDLGTGGPAVPLNTVLDKIFTTSGKITYNDNAKRGR